MVYRLSEKARSRNSTHSDIPGKRFTKLQIRIKAEFGNIQQNVVGALENGVRNVQIVQALQKQIAFRRIFFL